MKIISFGEILFDVFVHTSVVGGAPFNFVAHMCEMGAEGYLVTAIGEDALGEDALAEMRSHGVSTELVTVSEKPTGRCLVTLDGRGVPSYDLITGAYDDTVLPSAAKEIAQGGYDALYFGSLGQRGESAQRALYELISLGGYREAFFDINIRQHYYSKEIIENGMKNATILKFSREEAHVFDELGISSEKGEDLCRHLAGEYDLRQVIMTLDCDGAVLYCKQTDSFTWSPKPRARVVSTVGAGDSFCAAYLYSYLSGDSVDVSLAKATALSSYVVEHTEAIPAYSPELKKFINGELSNGNKSKKRV